MKVSIIIRTLNEEKYLNELLLSIENQKIDEEVEVVLVDSGSSDNTLEIAKKFNCKITYINKADFTFGRSLNIGCEYSSGDFLVFISGHCVPYDKYWLYELIRPLKNKKGEYIYGRQVGRDTTKFSEQMIFQKYYPRHKKNNNEKYFCNNANSAITKKIWSKYKFDENLTGLEDIDLARKIIADGSKVIYAHKSVVYHIHDESSLQTKNRYEREAIALKKIMPNIVVSLFDFFRYLFASIFFDCSKAIEKKVFFNEFIGIVKFRFSQYWGSYQGNRKILNNQENVSSKAKERYFYPK